MNVFFNSDGTSVTAFINVVQNGAHVDPTGWPITNDPAIVLSSHPSATKTVTKIDVGVYRVVWTGLSPALSNGDVVHIMIDGSIGSTAWSTWVIPVQVMRFPSTFNRATETVTVGTNNDKTGYELTPAEEAAIALATEQRLLNDADGQALLAAISSSVQALFDNGADVPVSTLVSLIRAQVDAAIAAYDPPTRNEATSDKQEVLNAVGQVVSNQQVARVI